MRLTLIALFNLIFLIVAYPQNNTIENTIKKEFWVAEYKNVISDCINIDTIKLTKWPPKGERTFVIFFRHLKRNIFAYETMDNTISAIVDPSSSILEKWKIHKNESSYILVRKDLKRRLYVHYKIIPEYNNEGKINIIVLTKIN